MTEYLTLHPTAVTYMDQWIHGEHAVLITLIEREARQKDQTAGLTLTELARMLNLGPLLVRNALAQLDADELIVIEQKKKFHTITLYEWVIGRKATPIPFTYDDTDATRLAVLEKEVQRLAVSKRAKEHSRLGEIFKGEERDLYLEIENARGYAIDEVESNLLAKMIQKFGIERTKGTLRQAGKARDPIRAAYAMLQKGIKGQGAKQVESEPFIKVRYREYKAEEE